MSFLENLYNDVQNSLQEALDFYNNDSSCNDFIEIKIKNNNYLMRKKEVIISLIDFFNFKELSHQNYQEIYELLLQLQNTAHSGYERNIYYNIRNYVNNYHMENQYNLKKIRENNNITRIMNNSSFVLCEIDRFNTFKRNQNVYDNMISILKIIRKCKLIKNIDYNYNDLKFSSKNDNSEIIAKRLLENSYKDLSSVRFLL